MEQVNERRQKIKVWQEKKWTEQINKKIREKKKRRKDKTNPKEKKNVKKRKRRRRKKKEKKKEERVEVDKQKELERGNNGLAKCLLKSEKSNLGKNKLW